jgi:hypothetical protein
MTNLKHQNLSITHTPQKFNENVKKKKQKPEKFDRTEPEVTKD